jgi:hypothetical protein
MDKLFFSENLINLSLKFGVWKFVKIYLPQLEDFEVFRELSFFKISVRGIWVFLRFASKINKKNSASKQLGKKSVFI